MFAHSLKDVRCHSKKWFVLELPTVPTVSAEGVKWGLGRHHFLEGDVLEGMPFVVKRGSRPNNWELHIRVRRMGQMRQRMVMLDGGVHTTGFIAV